MSMRLYLSPDPDAPELIAVLDLRFVEVRFVAIRGRLVAAVHCGSRLLAFVATGTG